MRPNPFSAGDLRVIDGDGIEWRGKCFRLQGYDAPETRNLKSDDDKALEWRRGEQAKLRLETLIAGARTLHLIPLGQIVIGNRELATLLIDGWDVATIATDEGWGVDYKDRKRIDWGDRNYPFPNLPVPKKVLDEEKRY